MKIVFGNNFKNLVLTYIFEEKEEKTEKIGKLVFFAASKSNFIFKEQALMLAIRNLCESFLESLITQ